MLYRFELPTACTMSVITSAIATTPIRAVAAGNGTSDIRDATISWLTTNNIRHDWLILRGPRQGAPSTAWKAGQLELLRAAGAEIQLCADDDQRNVEMMRGLGIPTLYIPSGYYGDRASESVEYR